MVGIGRGIISVTAGAIAGTLEALLVHDGDSGMLRSEDGVLETIRNESSWPELVCGALPAEGECAVEERRTFPAGRVIN